jgi:AcrR family transcriptional regulator
MAVVRKRAGRYHHGNLREALVLAAERQVVQAGSIDFTLREVAQAAGVSHAAAYRHFESKAQLLAELATRGFRALEAALGAAAHPRARPQQQLKGAGVAYVAFARAAPGQFRVMFHPTLKPFTQHPGLSEAAFDALGVLRRLVAACGGGEREVMATWSLVHGQALLELDGQLQGPFGVTASSAQAAAGEAFEVLLAGLGLPALGHPGSNRRAAETSGKGRRNVTLCK